MLFRRVAQHFSEQNWTAVFIDFLIVVIGVFIGIQVSNWNAQRDARKLEQGYLVRLHGDIRRSIDGIDRDNQFAQEQVNDMKALLSALRDCEVSEKQQNAVQRAFNTMGLVSPPRFYRRTYDELASAGRMDIISNDLLAEELAEIVAVVEWRTSIMPSLFRETEFHRNKVNESVLRNLDSQISMVNGFVEWNAGVDYDIKALCRHPTLANSVSAIGMLTKDLVANASYLAVQYRRLLNSIEAELQRRWGIAP